MTSPTSLLDRAGLDRDTTRRHLAHGLEGADDGELFPRPNFTARLDGGLRHHSAS